VTVSQHMVVMHVPKTSPFAHYLIPNDQILEVQRRRRNTVVLKVKGHSPFLQPCMTREIFEKTNSSTVTVNRIWNMHPVPERRFPASEWFHFPNLLK